MNSSHTATQKDQKSHYLNYVTSEISTKGRGGGAVSDRHPPVAADLHVWPTGDTSNQTNGLWGNTATMKDTAALNFRSNLKSSADCSSYALTNPATQSNMVPTQNVSSFAPHSQQTSLSHSQSSFGESSRPPQVRKIPASRSIPNFQTVSSGGQGSFSQRSMLVSEQMPHEMSLFSDDHYSQYPRGFGGSGIGGHGYVNSGVQRKLNFAELKDIMWRKSAHSLIKQLASDVSNSSSSEQQRRIRTAAVIDRTAPTTIRRHRSQSTGRSANEKRSKSIGQITPRPNTYLQAPSHALNQPNPYHPHSHISALQQTPVSVETVLKYPILRQTMV